MKQRELSIIYKTWIIYEFLATPIWFKNQGNRVRNIKEIEKLRFSLKQILRSLHAQMS